MIIFNLQAYLEVESFAPQNKRYITFNKLPTVLLAKSMTFLSIDDVISLDMASTNHSLRSLMIHALRYTEENYWKSTPINSDRVLSFIISRDVFKFRKNINFRELLQINLTSANSNNGNGNVSPSACNTGSNLIYAVNHNLPHIVKWLVEQWGEDVDQVDSRGRCALSMCCMQNMNMSENNTHMLHHHYLH